MCCEQTLTVRLNTLPSIIISLCSASCVSWQRDTSRICCWAPCCGVATAERRTCSNRSMSLAQTRSMQRSAAGEWWDRRTDGRPTVTQSLLRILRIWYSLPEDVVSVDHLSLFIRRLERVKLNKFLIGKMWMLSCVQFFIYLDLHY